MILVSCKTLYNARSLEIETKFIQYEYWCFKKHGT